MMFSPVDTELSRRFATSYATAAFGYARAASAAYATLANQALEFWGGIARPASGWEEPGRAKPMQLVTGPRPYRSAVTEPVLAAPPSQAQATDFARNPYGWAAPMFASVRAWWDLFPLDGNPASWPMAHAMMTAGVPRTVALPVAEANVAALDAVDAAQTSISRAFSAYSPAGRYAAPQVTMPNVWLGALFLSPFTGSYKVSWN